MEFKASLVLLSLFAYGCVHSTSDTVDESIVKELYTENDSKQEKTYPSNKDTDISPIEIEPYRGNEDVKKWIHYFTHQGRKHFALYLERGEAYRPLIEEILARQGLPKYLYYLALIESGFSVQATSSAKAVGIWQFIPPTGQRYGLRINQYVDERRDPIRSTIAATKYLRDLHNVFHSWFLAFAAYNTGESRIFSAIMRRGTRDYWELSEMNAFVDQTQNYVPKFIAAALIGENPQEYGFAVPERIPSPQLQSVIFPSPVKLADIANESGVSYEQIQLLNPHLLRGVTPPTQSTYRVWLPAGVVIQPQKIASLKRTNTWAPESPKKKTEPALLAHQVRKGETLAAIARRYKMSALELKKFNRLRSKKIIAGQELKIPSLAKKENYVHYRVRKGDSLHFLAEKFGMTVDEIKKINEIGSSSIYPGQILKIIDQT